MKVIVLVRHSPGVLMALIAVLATILGPPLAPPVGAIEFGCRIGKPSYCFKYGGSRCLATNTVPKREAACEAWTEACLECHRDIPDCFGKVRPLAGTPACAACDQRWIDCMHRADARYWPERLKPTPED